MDTQVSQPEGTKTVSVIAIYAGEARETLKKLAKRAAKYGQTIQWTERAYTREVVRKLWNGKKTVTLEDMIDFEITGSAPRVGKFRFLAKLEAENGGIMISSVTGVEIGDLGRDWDGRCDHCGVKRNRSKAFVVEGEDGRQIVGKSCLRDYLGTDEPAGLIAQFGYHASIDAMGEDEDGFGGWGGGRWEESTLGVIAASRAAIALWGWKPRSACAEHERSTSDMVHLIYGRRSKPDADRDRLLEEMKLRGEHYEEIAEKVMEWGRNLNPRNDYEHNLRVAIGGSHVAFKNLGIAVSASAAYDRQVAKESEWAAKKEAAVKAKAALPKSTHFGEIKKRASVIVTIDRIIGLADNGWGASILYLMHTDAGHILSWKTSANTNTAIDGQRLEVGNRVLATFTPKEHVEYREEAQTRITRCKVEAEPMPGKLAA